MGNEEKRNYCASCKQDTRHAVLHSVKNSSQEFYEWEEYYEIVRCKGCDDISFRYEFVNFMERYFDPLTQSEEPRITAENYPNTLRGHNILRPIYYLPKSIRNVYEDTLRAFSAKSLILAGAGFRAIIEAICIEEQIKGRDLQEKIEKLAENSLITRREAKRLHSIRFLGNDSEMV